MCSFISFADTGTVLVMFACDCINANCRNYIRSYNAEQGCKSLSYILNLQSWPVLTKEIYSGKSSRYEYSARTSKKKFKTIILLNV